MRRQLGTQTLVLLGCALSAFGRSACATPPPPDIAPNAVVPSAEQLEYQRMEFIGFVHFTVNTFTDKEWGFGDESPAIFNPTAFDADQWARVAAEVGMGELILTAKHHDGFALWPSQYTEHSVKNSPWKGGEGDVVGAFVEAARRHGVKVGLYLSPWDRNHAEYGRPQYIEYYRNQLRELLRGYGKITEIWVDGANGGTGHYGGANEERRIDRETYYGWDETFALVKSLQPGTLIFSDAGPDIRWIGNEHGFAGETNWSMIDTDDVVVGAADQEYLNSGDPDGTHWTVPLCDTSIRPGWFYHAELDRVVLQEPIRFGQRISKFAVEARVEGEWTPLARGTTIGYKRILRTPRVTADRLRIRIEDANNVPALSNVGLFQASPSESAD